MMGKLRAKRGTSVQYCEPTAVARQIQSLEAEIAYRQLLLEEVIHRTKNMLQLAVAALDEHIDSASLEFRLSEVCSSICASFGERQGRIALSLAVADIQLERHQELSVSLILQELLMNALKHAFPGDRPGTIMVDLDADADGICHLVVRDNGVGRALTEAASTGLTHVNAFAAGLGGSVDIASHCGTTVSVSFPLVS